MKNRARNFLFLLLFLVGFTILMHFLGGAGVTPNFDEDALTVNGPEKFSFTVEYDHIARLELVQLTDAGELISGGENRSYYWGVWENSAWGQYTLCASKKVDTAILVTTRDNERLIFNYQNNDVTSDILDMFTELLAHR